MSSDIRLLDPWQIDDTILQARHARLIAFSRHAGTEIANVSTRLQLLQCGEQLFPLSINDGDEATDNSYVVSPLTTYSGYASYELAQIHRPWLSWPLQQLLRGISHWLQQAALDRLVQVNNWLLSTNLYPADWQSTESAELTRFLCSHFPEHAIGFRSLNRFSNAHLLEQLQACGYVAIPSRQVYLFDGRSGTQSAFLQRHNTRLDAGLLRNAGYRCLPGAQLQPADYPRLAQLYRQLYLEKYSPLNPQFSANWLYHGQRDGWLQLCALQNSDGRLDGVVGWFTNEHILTAPIVGYDTALPKKLGLYRQLTRLCLQRAADECKLLNFSSGAADFKRRRGGVAEIEYSMLYVRHLPPARQRAWHMLGRLLHGIGVPLLRRLKL
jgi:hypothetical protein